jgi:cell division protein FtsQ
VTKSNANGGNASVLDDPAADFDRPQAPGSGARLPRSSRPAPDPDAGDEVPFLRARRRVPVRRGLIPAWAKTPWGFLFFLLIILLAIVIALAAVLAVRSFVRHDPRFRIESSASIQIVGNSQLTRPELLSVFGSDIGHNLFFVPLAARRAQLEQIPWVENATVMRVLPNQIRVAVKERTPIAFVLVHGQVELADAAGVILDMTPQQMAAKHYAFPVVSGINPADPLSVRTARMHLYQKFLADLDSGGENVSARLSEINLSDPEDVRATLPVAGSEILLYFGQEDFLARWRNYESHIAQWRQQYPRLASVDLRYAHEVVLKMAPDPSAKPAPKPVPLPPPAAHKPVKHAPPQHRHAARSTHRARRGAA